MVGTWLGEIRSCSAWVLLNKIYQYFFHFSVPLVPISDLFSDCGVVELPGRNETYFCSIFLFSSS